MALRDTILEIIGRHTGKVSVAIKNFRSGETIMVDETRVFPSASTIKLVILSELMREVEEGVCALGDRIILKAGAKVGGDGILKELDPDRDFSLRELATLMIVMSDNTATNMLIDLIGMEAVNRRATELGLSATRLQRKMMDTVARKAGRENLTCAADMLRVLEATYRGGNVSKEASGFMLDMLKRQQATGRLDLYLPIEDEGIVIAHKTGDLDRLEHDVGIVYLPSCEYAICVLTCESRTNKDGREAIGEISRAAYEEYW